MWYRKSQWKITFLTWNNLNMKYFSNVPSNPSIIQSTLGDNATLYQKLKPIIFMCCFLVRLPKWLGSGWVQTHSDPGDYSFLFIAEKLITVSLIGSSYELQVTSYELVILSFTIQEGAVTFEIEAKAETKIYSMWGLAGSCKGDLSTVNTNP